MIKIFYTMLEPAFFSGLAFFSIICAAMLVFIWRKKSSLSKIILVYFIACSIVIFSINIFVKKPYASTTDSYSYNIAAADMANNIKHEPLKIFSYISLKREQYYNPAYIIIIAIIYMILNNSIIAGELFSALCGALFLYQLYYFTEFIYDRKTAIYTTFLLAISPWYVFISARLLRETLCLLAIITFLRLWQRHQQHFSWKNLILMSLLIAYLIFLRAQFAALLMLVGAIYITCFIIFRKISMKGLLIWGSSICLGLFLLINQMPEIIENPLLMGFKEAQMERMEAREEFSAGVSYNYAEPVKYDSLYDIVSTVPKMSFYFMTVPLPWQQTTNMKVFACLADSAALWIIYLLALLEVRKLWRDNRKWGVILLSYLVIGIAGASLLQASLSNAMRHRLAFTVFILPLAAHRLVLWREKRRGRATARNPSWGVGAGLPLAAAGSGARSGRSGRAASARRAQAIVHEGKER